MMRVGPRSIAAASACKGQTAARGSRSYHEASAPRANPVGTARITAPITQTYSGKPPGRLSGSSATAGIGSLVVSSSRDIGASP